MKRGSGSGRQTSLALAAPAGGIASGGRTLSAQLPFARNNSSNSVARGLACGVGRTVGASAVFVG